MSKAVFFLCAVVFVSATHEDTPNPKWLPVELDNAECVHSIKSVIQEIQENWKLMGPVPKEHKATLVKTLSKLNDFLEKASKDRDAKVLPGEWLTTPAGQIIRCSEKIASEVKRVADAAFEYYHDTFGLPNVES